MALVTAADPFRLCPVNTTLPDQRDLGGLGEVFEAFQEAYTDHLSQQQLVPWKAELQRFVSGESQPDLIAQRIAQGVAKLAREIAIDALTGQTLRDPVLDGDWVYELSTHADCYALFEGRSPLDGRVMAKDPPPHHFAAKVLAWARGAQKESHEENCEVVLAPSAALRKNVYRQMAWYAVQRRKLQLIPARMEQGFKAALVVVDRTLARADEKNALILANAERNQAAHEEEMRNRLAGIQQTYQARISGLEDRMAASEQLHLKEITSLREQMAAHDQTELAVLKTIQAEIARKEEAQRAARQAMADQVATIEASRKSEVDRLHSAHAASEARSQGKISRLETTETKLQASLEQAESRTISVQGQLAAAHARNAETEARLARQQNEIFQTQLALQILREDIDDQPFFKIGPLKFF